MRQYRRRRNGTGLALAGLLSLAVVLGGCDVVNNILGRSGGQTAAAAGGFGGGAGGGGFGGQTAAVPVVDRGRGAGNRVQLSGGDHHAERRAIPRRVGTRER